MFNNWTCLTLVCCLWLTLRSPRGDLHPRPTELSTTQRGRRPWVDLFCARKSRPNLSDADDRENQWCARECPDNRTETHNRSSQLSGHWSLYLLWSEQPGNNHRDYRCRSSLWVPRMLSLYPTYKSQHSNIQRLRTVYWWSFQPK